MRPGDTVNHRVWAWKNLERASTKAADALYLLVAHEDGDVVRDYGRERAVLLCRCHVVRELDADEVEQLKAGGSVDDLVA
jgi:hypothetical protein